MFITIATVLTQEINFTKKIKLAEFVEKKNNIKDELTEDSMSTKIKEFSSTRQEIRNTGCARINENLVTLYDA